MGRDVTRAERCGVGDDFVMDVVLMVGGYKGRGSFLQNLKQISNQCKLSTPIVELMPILLVLVILLATMFLPILTMLLG